MKNLLLFIIGAFILSCTVFLIVRSVNDPQKIDQKKNRSENFVVSKSSNEHQAESSKTRYVGFQKEQNNEKENVNEGAKLSDNKRLESGLKVNQQDAKEVDVYMFMSRYHSNTRRVLQNNGYQPVRLLISAFIDPNKTGDFDKQAVKAYFDRAYSVDDTTLCIINWEQEHYSNLRLQQTSVKFMQAEKQFIELINYIKELRPNVKLGVYGLPFWVFTNKYPHYGKKSKFDNILEKCDVISPALYSRSLDEEIGQDKNDLYLKNNLEIAFEYSNRLGRPVIPFVWELVHPMNKKYGGTLINKREFNRRIANIVNYNSSGKKVSGLIWWAPSKPLKTYLNYASNEQTSKINSFQAIDPADQLKVLNSVRDRITLEYAEEIFNNVMKVK